MQYGFTIWASLVHIHLIIMCFVSNMSIPEQGNTTMQKQLSKGGENHGESAEDKLGCGISLTSMTSFHKCPTLWCTIKKKESAPSCVMIILHYTWTGHCGLSLLWHFLRLSWDSWHLRLLIVVSLGMRYTILCMDLCNKGQLKFLYVLLRSHKTMDCCFAIKKRNCGNFSKDKYLFH